MNHHIVGYIIIGGNSPADRRTIWWWRKLWVACTTIQTYSIDSVGEHIARRRTIVQRLCSTIHPIQLVLLSPKRIVLWQLDTSKQLPFDSFACTTLCVQSNPIRENGYQWNAFVSIVVLLTNWPLIASRVCVRIQSNSFQSGAPNGVGSLLHGRIDPVVPNYCQVDLCAFATPRLSVR